MTNPSANQNRPPRHDPFRYFACASSAWLALRARVVAAARTAGPVSPGVSLGRESPAAEWVLQPALECCHHQQRQQCPSHAPPDRWPTFSMTSVMTALCCHQGCPDLRASPNVRCRGAFTSCRHNGMTNSLKLSYQCSNRVACSRKVLPSHLEAMQCYTSNQATSTRMIQANMPANQYMPLNRIMH